MMTDEEAFNALELMLVSALAQARENADRRGVHGRRFALLATKIEEAWFQAKQGSVEVQDHGA